MILTRAVLCLLCTSLWTVVSADLGHQQQAHQQHDQESFFDKQDIGHIKHDIKDQYYVDLDDKQVNERELEFYNFKLHDYDENLLLDGLELLFALNHDTYHAPTDPEQPATTYYERQLKWHQKFEDDSTVIDHILGEYDKDKDGYISFYEYMQVKVKYGTTGGT